MKTIVRWDPPSLPLSVEELEVPANPFKKSPILISKNVLFANFTIEAPAFHIESSWV